MSKLLTAQVAVTRVDQPDYCVSRHQATDIASVGAMVSLHANDAIGIAAGVSRIVADLGFNIDASKSFELRNRFVVNQVISSDADQVDCLIDRLNEFKERLASDSVGLERKNALLQFRSRIRLVALDRKGLLASVQERIAHSRGSIDSEDSETAVEDDMRLFLSAIRVRHFDAESVRRMKRLLEELRSEDCYLEIAPANLPPRCIFPERFSLSAN